MNKKTYFDYKFFLFENHKKGKTEKEQKELVVGYFLHFGADHVRAAQILKNLKDPTLYQSVGVLCHIALEITLKGLVIWEYNGYDKNQFGSTGHDLFLIANHIPDIKNALSRDDLNKIKTIDKLFDLRYPIKHSDSNKGDIFKSECSLQKEEAGEESFDKNFQKGEVGDELLDEAFRLYDRVVELMPDEVYKIYENIDPCRKGGTVLMRKKLDSP